MPTYRMTLLEQMRLDAGLTHGELSEITGVPARTIRAVERGAEPRVRTAAPLARHFGIPVSQFISSFRTGAQRRLEPAAQEEAA